MTDNLFDRLAELLQSSGPVNWRLGREIAESVAGPPEPIDPWLDEEYRDLANTAALRISASSPLDASVAGIHAVDRRSWATRNIESFSYLAEPVGEKLAGPGGGPLGAAIVPLGPALLGLQMGAMVGFMSHRVLGQFDIGLLTLEDEGAEFVVPNIEEFATGHGLEPRQTRLWVALHEVAHNATMSVPWTREHFMMLTHQFVEGLQLDPEVLRDRMEGFQDPEELQRLLEDPGDGGLTGLFAGEDGAEVLGRMQAFMAVIEGYGDHLIEHAAPGLIPEAPRIREALDRRRAEPSQGEQILQQLLGLNLDHVRYRRGSTFCAEVARRWGDEALEQLWEGPDSLPTPEELQDVVGWAARVLL